MQLSKAELAFIHDNGCVDSIPKRIEGWDPEPLIEQYRPDQIETLKKAYKKCGNASTAARKATMEARRGRIILKYYGLMPLSKADK